MTIFCIKIVLISARFVGWQNASANCPDHKYYGHIISHGRNFFCKKLVDWPFIKMCCYSHVPDKRHCLKRALEWSLVLVFQSRRLRCFGEKKAVNILYKDDLFLWHLHRNWCSLLVVFCLKCKGIRILTYIFILRFVLYMSDPNMEVFLSYII